MSNIFWKAAAGAVLIAGTAYAVYRILDKRFIQQSVKKLIEEEGDFDVDLDDYGYESGFDGNTEIFPETDAAPEIVEQTGEADEKVVETSEKNPDIISEMFPVFPIDHENHDVPASPETVDISDEEDDFA